MKKFFKILFWSVLIFELIVNVFLVSLDLIFTHSQRLYDLPDSVWYSEETNMKATVYADYGETPYYMLITDLDDGREYKMLLYGRDEAVFCKGDSDNGNDLYCKCGTSLEVKRIFLKVRGFEIDVADGCTHFPCDAEFRRGNINS